jgi:hypothetical protein
MWTKKKNDIRAEQEKVRQQIMKQIESPPPPTAPVHPPQSLYNIWLYKQSLLPPCPDRQGDTVDQRILGASKQFDMSRKTLLKK